MYGRLIEFSGADPEKREKAIETINETVIPADAIDESVLPELAAGRKREQA